MSRLARSLLLAAALYLGIVHGLDRAGARMSGLR